MALTVRTLMELVRAPQATLVQNAMNRARKDITARTVRKNVRVVITVIVIRSRGNARVVENIKGHIVISVSIKFTHFLSAIPIFGFRMFLRIIRNADLKLLTDFEGKRLATSKI